MFKRSERGASMVEFAIVAPLLLLLVMGMVEYGLAFKARLTIASASREGARVGSSAGTDASADYYILQAVETALSGAIDRSKITEVVVQKPGGSPSTAYRPVATVCGWNPCPKFGDPSYSVPNWNPASRSVSIATLDKIEVLVRLDHTWVTGFVPGLTGTRVFTERTTMRLEPQFT